jgi:diguanylate cyclase (GGDEF)-like protein/PAS domain S-box-containing protein
MLENKKSVIEIYKSFFEHNPDATYAILPNGEFVLFNEAACKLTGYTQVEALGMPFAKVIAPDFLELTQNYFHQALTGKNEAFQSVLLSKKGERKTVSIKIIPILIDQEILGIIGVTKDITEQVILETLNQGQNKVLKMITKNMPFDTVLDEITLLFEKISTTGAKCSIMIMDENHNTLLDGSAPSLPKAYLEILNGLSIGKKIGSCGTAAFTKKMVIVENTLTDRHWEDFHELVTIFNLHACWSIPLIDDDDDVLGTFAVYFDHPRSPNDKDLQLLEEASYLSGIAIQHYKTKEKINHMAFHDPLTGLPNRRLFDEKVEKALTQSRQLMDKFSVLFIDLDRFKNINDTYGHDIGDLFLVEVSKRLTSCLTGDVLIARQGGDEFTILLENSSLTNAEEVGDRIVRVMEQAFIIEGIEIFVTPSIGISVYPDHGSNSVELLKKADAAMYHAKNEGGNNFKFHDASLAKKDIERLTLENHLHKALENDEFTLHYQPKIDLSSNKITGVESLIRWENPVLGMIRPDQFIPIAEETGMIISIGEWVLEEACKQLSIWKEQEVCDLTVSVNLSIRQFFNPNLIPSIQRVIKQTGIDPSLLDLEITESMTMKVEVAREILNELKKLGVRISIDDFGTGYSSFNYLKYFPIDYIKIDKSFINDITHDVQSENIVQVFFMLAKTIGFKVVAEGVETKEQLDKLRALNCHEVQGYFFSKPLPKDEIKAFFLQFNHRENNLNTKNPE